MEHRRYFGCQVRQRIDSETVHFFVFYARAKDIVQWVGVRRVQESQDGTQRILRPTRRRAITRFLKSFSRNTIPNNILLAFEDEAKNFKFTSLDNQLSECFDETLSLFNDCNDCLEWGVVDFDFDPSLPVQNRPGLVVDGQHRLYGISDYLEEDLPLLIVSLVNAPVQEQAFQFVVINNKAVRVPTDNVKAIIAHVDEDDLRDRLLQAGVTYGNKSPVLRDINDEVVSPFQHLLDWPYNKNGPQIVSLTAIEQSLKYIRKLFELEEDSDSLLEIFCAVWRSVKASYPNLWGQDSKLMRKISINALNEFISNRLKYAWEMSMIDIFDTKAVENQTLGIVNLLPEEFWAADWALEIKDNLAVKNLIQADLETLANNSRMRRDWKEGLKLPRTDNS